MEQINILGLEELEVKQEVKEVETTKEEVTKEEATKEEAKTPSKKVKKVTKKEVKEEAKKDPKEEAKQRKANLLALKNKLINDITTKNKDYKENVSIKVTSKYDGVRYKNRIVCELETVGRGIIVRTLDIYGDMFEQLQDTYNHKIEENELQMKRTPKRFAWNTSCEHLLENEKQYKQCLNALVLSVEKMKKDLKEREEAKKEEAKKKAEAEAKKEDKKEEK